MESNEEPDPQHRSFRVLCLDGGGMRGIYTARYLSVLADGFAKKRGLGKLDVGAAFDLIVGTSTGAIIGCALAADKDLDEVVRFYRDIGPQVFKRPLPSGGVQLSNDLLRRSGALKEGEAALRGALHKMFGGITLGGIYKAGRPALAITSVDLAQHKSWVFKTPHHPKTSHRDDNYTLVSACLASSAAPLYRSIAVVPTPGGGSDRMFVDGGLWANNPVLVGLIEALEIAPADQRIEVFCLGTCPRPAGEDIAMVDPNRGLMGWRFGGLAAQLAIDAQEFAYDNMAEMLVKHLARKVDVVRFPSQTVPAALMPYLEIDDTRPAAMSGLVQQAETDAHHTNSRCGKTGDPQGALVNRLFLEMPEKTPTRA